MLRQISVTLQTEMFSTDSSDFLRQIIFLKSFNSVFDKEVNSKDCKNKKKMDHINNFRSCPQLEQFVENFLPFENLCSKKLTHYKFINS